MLQVRRRQGVMQPKVAQNVSLMTNLRWKSIMTYFTLKIPYDQFYVENSSWPILRWNPLIRDRDRAWHSVTEARITVETFSDLLRGWNLRQSTQLVEKRRLV